MTPSAGAASAVEAAIAAAAAECGRFPGPFDPAMPFALLGFDSLGTIEMAAAIEDRLGCDLPPDLLLECPDGRTLAARVTALLASTTAADRDAEFDRMLRDAALPGDVLPQVTRSVSTDLRQARSILLTGATGFLGGAVLKALRASTSARIRCLVRRPGLVHDDVIVGDLSHPRVGLSTTVYEQLAGSIDAIVHCGAAVNWIYPYAALRDANVLGTLELLRLACRRGASFHFVSSLSTCYSTDGPRDADESFDAIGSIRGVRLGYAQTKSVAEALVREAGMRGLPVRIYRPALISGDSVAGTYNAGDLVTTLIRGCVHMGTAPDLDWKLDALPVDTVAQGLVELSGVDGETVFHLAHDRPRHWRECVLWMRMYGYPLTLVPFAAWLRQLDRDTAGPGAALHPLRPLRSFFLQRHPDAGGLTLPELYEEGRRTTAVASRTHAHLHKRGVSVPPLDAGLLDTYFAAFRAAGDLPAPPRRGGRIRQAVGDSAVSRDFVGSLLNRPVASVRLLSTGSDHSIVSELTAWRSRRPSGLFHLEVQFADGSFEDVRVKVKAADSDVIGVGDALAGLVDPDIGRLYGGFSDGLGFKESHRREIAIYRQVDPRFTAHAPALLGSISDDETATWALALENVTGAAHSGAPDHTDDWTTGDIIAAIDGLAALHAIWYAREAELQTLPWIGHVRSTAGMAGMSELWTAMAKHAGPSFSSWAHPSFESVHRRLIDSLDRWWPALERAPRTLIHHDFNTRNICLRSGRLCAYDWELATMGAPQRDLAELLCFVLPPSSSLGDAQHWINHHRAALERQTGRRIDPVSWQDGFRAGLYDLLVDRLATYAVVHRVRRQSFLPRVIQTWYRLYQLFPNEVSQ